MGETDKFMTVGGFASEGACVKEWLSDEGTFHAVPDPVQEAFLVILEIAVAYWDKVWG